MGCCPLIRGKRHPRPGARVRVYVKRGGQKSEDRTAWLAKRSKERLKLVGKRKMEQYLKTSPTDSH